MNMRDQLMATWDGFLQSLVEWTPRVVVGILLFVVAFIVAKLIERLLRVVLKGVRLDALLATAGLDKSLRQIGLRQSIEVLVPKVVYYLLLILFARTGSDALGLVSISSAIGTFMGYLPNVIAAIFIVLLGSAAAQFASRAVAEAAENAGIEFASSLGSIVSAVLLFVIGIMAVGQLQIDTEIVRLVTAALLAGLALAFGLSFGLGSRDITRGIIAGFYARKTFQMGEPLEIRGETGTLMAITPLQTLLEKDGKVIAVANTVFLEEVVKQ